MHTVTIDKGRRMDAEGMGATADDVEAHLVSYFAGDTRAAVRRMLAGVVALPHVRAPAHRVQVAILRLADGDVDAVRRWADVAAQDTRDVLAAAFYPDA